MSLFKQHELGLAPFVKGNRILEKCYPFLGLPIERLFSCPKINEACAKAFYACQKDPNTNFFTFLVNYFQYSYAIQQADLSKIPKSGPLIIVCNHPFGGIDGLLHGHITLSRRSDAKFMSNNLTAGHPALEPWTFSVNNWDSGANKHSNAQTLLSTIRWLKKGHCLGVFPAGEVAYFSIKKGRILEPPWLAHIAKMAQISKANIVPMYFDGRNSLWFNLLGLIHPRLRTFSLLNEMFNKPKCRQTRIVIGKMMTAKNLRCMDSKVANDWLRGNTLMLKHRPSTSDHLHKIAVQQHSIRRTQSALAPPISPHLLAENIANLPLESLLLTQGEFQVYCAKHHLLPSIMPEIGRLRELTYRLAEEGTGNSTDLDSFDPHYQHLFVWNKQHKAIAGAYRIVTFSPNEKSPKLYINTLFKLDPKFFKQLGPGIELGRSFVSPAYQKRAYSLMLLWKGIGEFLYRNQQYRALFGPVSIANSYRTVSKIFMVNFLKKHAYDDDLAQWVKARTPWKEKQRGDALSVKPQSIEQLNYVVENIEGNKGIPVLLRHYLRINCQLVGFNRDPDFSDVLDGLITINLRSLDPKTLAKYCGLTYCSEQDLLERMR